MRTIRHTWGDDNVRNILVGKPARKRPPGRSRHGYKNNIKLDIRKYVVRLWTGFNWFGIVSSVRLL